MIKNLNNLDAQNTELFGGKACSLARLTQKSEFLIPPAMVLSTQINPSNLEIYQDKIVEMLDTLSGDFFAVRSSANIEDGLKYSFAGMFDSYLNVPKNDLIKAVSRCYQGLENNRLGEYIDMIGVDKNQIKLAVIVQEMIASEIAGVAFTKHPVSEDWSQIYIESVQGLGENLVGGVRTPNSYLVDKTSLNTIQTQNVSSSNDLNTKQIKTLAQIAISIENIFGYQADIEWALFENKFYILQVRPITF